MRNSLRCYYRCLSTSLGLEKCRKECNILEMILAQGFCPMRIKITQFPGGFRLKDTGIYSKCNIICRPYQEKLNYNSQVNLDVNDVNKNTAPENILKLFSPVSSVHTYNTRTSTSEHFHTKESRLNVKRNAFSGVGVKIWNGIPQILNKRPKKAFKGSLKAMLSFKLKSPILTQKRLLRKLESNSLVLYIFTIRSNVFPEI